LINNSIIVSEMDYRNIFTDIAEKLFKRDLIDGDEKIKLLNIINSDKSLLRKAA